jgi:hypothetical protein
MLSSAATFGFFMSIGSVSLCFLRDSESERDTKGGGAEIETGRGEKSEDMLIYRSLGQTRHTHYRPSE